MKIGIIGGALGERIPEEPYKKWMDTISLRYYNKNNGDYMFEPGLAEGLKVRYKDVTDAVYIKNDLIEKELQKNDVNFLAGLNLIYGWETSPHKYKQWIKIMKNKKNNIYPPYKEQEFLYDKGKYLMYYKKKGIPIAPTFIVRKQRDTDYILQQVKKNNWEAFVLKPHHAYANVDIKRFNMDDKHVQEKLKKFLQKNKKYPGFVCQEVMIGFKEHYEVKTFWINGEYKYHVAMKTTDGSVFPIDEISDESGSVYFGSNLVSQKVIQQVKKMGEKIVKHFPSVPIKGVTKPPLYLRLDFGCCQGNTLDTSKYFLNEIEYAGCRILLDGAGGNAIDYWIRGYYEKACQLTNHISKISKKKTKQKSNKYKKGRSIDKQQYLQAKEALKNI